MTKRKTVKIKVKSEAEELLDESGLTEKNKIFCREYIFDWNATRSYLIAYPDVKDNNVAAAAASRMLSNVNIKDYIKLIQEDLEKLAGISRMKVISEHMKIAFSTIAHLHNTWAERKEFDQLTDEQKQCIEEISTKTQQKTVWIYNPDTDKKEPEDFTVEYVKIKLYDKQKSLDAINKMLGYDAPIKTIMDLNFPVLPKVTIE
jgi:phage terminase small subunit